MPKLPRISGAEALRALEGFEPVAQGVRLMLPHVDAFLPAHNVESLTDLARALGDTSTPAHRAPGSAFPWRSGLEDQAASGDPPLRSRPDARGGGPRRTR